MSKEIVFSIMIVIFIVLSNIFVSRFIDGKLNYIIDELNELERILDTDGYDSANNKIEEMKEYWDKNEAILSCYIEHDELEKIKTEYTELRGYIKTKNDQSYSSLYKMIFIVEHIEAKDDMRLKNIL